MTLDIIKSKPTVTVDNTLSESNVTALAAGMVNGSVTDIHSAVECVNKIDKRNLNGGAVRSQYTKLLKELKEFDGKADGFARDGKSITEITTALKEYEVNFLAVDLKTMKTEVYGSVVEWKSAMVTTDEV